MNGTELSTARRLLGRLPFVDPGRPPLPARCAFLTGASSGIGKALAAELCARGYDVYLTARRIELLEELRAQLTAAFPQRSVTVAALDVTEHEAVARAVDDAARQFGALGMVIANAGVDVGGNIGEGRFEGHRAVVDVNLLGAMATIDAAVAHFRSQGGGQVVGFSSVVAGTGLPGGAPYCASKAGLARYLQSLRGELWNSGITVTTIAPGYIDTPINEALGDKRPFLIDPHGRPQDHGPHRVRRRPRDSAPSALDRRRIPAGPAPDPSGAEAQCLTAQARGPLTVRCRAAITRDLAGGRVFVCGDGRHLAPAVREAFMTVCSVHTGAGRDEARAWPASPTESGHHAADVRAD